MIIGIIGAGSLLAGAPRTNDGRRVLSFAGADAPAKAEVAALIDKLGFFGIDLGQVTEGGRATWRDQSAW